MSNVLIPCQRCGHMLPRHYSWFVCDECGYRVCQHCQGKHTGPHGNGGYKCSQCALGHLEIKRA